MGSETDSETGEVEVEVLVETEGEEGGAPGAPVPPPAKKEPAGMSEMRGTLKVIAEWQSQANDRISRLEKLARQGGDKW